MFDRNLMKLEGMPAVMAALVLLALLQAGAIIIQAFMLSGAISALWAGSTLSECLPQIAAFFSSFCILQLLRFCQETLLDSFSRKRSAELQAELVHACFDGKRLLARRIGTAAAATAITEGIGEIQTYIRIIPPKIVGIAATSMPILVAVYIADWPSGIILTVMLPVTAFFMVLLGKQARAQSEKRYATYTLLQNRFMDTLRGIRTISAFQAGEAEGASVYSFSEKLRIATIRTLSTATLSSAVLDLCAVFGVAAVSMMLAFRLLDGSIVLQTGLVALILSPEYFLPIRSFASDFHASLDGKNAFSSALSLIEQPDASENEPDCEPVAPWTAESTLEMKGVGFSYGDSSPALHDVDVTLSGFGKYAVIGESGAGKSTFADLVAGFAIPSCGETFVDGHNVSLDDASWTGQVRYIPQNPYVFRASIADNVRFYNPSASDEEVVAAVDAVGLGGFVQECPDGIDTLIGEGERGLSGGQAHRIALARVLVDPAARIVVFDEPTAHLDLETELELKEHMLSLMEGRLTVFATHRLHWLADMDVVIELAKGSVRNIREVKS